MTDTTKRAAIYTRVSDPKQEKGYSLQTQLDACRQYAQEHNLSVASEHEFVESFTSTTLSRPQMDKLLDQAEVRAFDTLILYCMDRLSRGGPGHQWYLENEFKRHGVNIVYVMEHYEDNAEGDLHKQLQSAVAQYERAKLLERTTRGRRGRAKEGKYIPGGSIRYGYRYVLKTKEDVGHVEIASEEADTVKLIFWLYNVEKLSMRAIADRLTQMQIPTRFDKTPTRHKTKHGKNFWAWTTINGILQYEGYTGTHWYNLTAWHKDEDGKVKRIGKRDKSEWIKLTIPAIIDCETWEAAQAQRTNNTKNTRRNPQYEYLMRSRLKCAVCGSTFVVDTDARSKKGPLQYYLCLGERPYHSADGHTKVCPRHLRADRWDAMIWAYVRAVLLEPKTMLHEFNERQARSKKAVASLDRRLQTIETKIASNTASQKQLLDDFIDKSSISRDALEAKAAQLNSMNVELQAEANNLRAQLDRTAISKERIENALAWCERARVGIDLFTFEDKLFVINLLDLTGIVQRGETPDQDTITVSGFVPTVTLEPGGLLNGSIMLNGLQGLYNYRV